MESGTYAFISYSSKNQAMADATRSLFKECGISCWMAPYDIPAGGKYAYVINDALENCGCLLLLLTNDSQTSQFVEREVERAITYHKPIITMQLENVVLNSGFKFYIGYEQIVAVHDIDANNPGMQKIINGVKAFVGTSRSVDETTEEPAIEQEDNEDLDKIECPVIAEGKVNEYISWQLDNEGCLSICGEGEMPDFKRASDAPWKEYDSLIKKVYLSMGITSIGRLAFHGHERLESITIPNSVKSVGFNAFFECSSLKSITIPDSVENIGLGAFWKCENLEDITIPDSVTSIRSFAFYKCSSLESIIIPDSMTTIEEYTFNECSRLKSITIPDSVTSIGNKAFWGCGSLKKIVLPRDVKVKRKSFDKVTEIEYR